MGFHPLKTIVKKDPAAVRVRVKKNSEENLDKDSLPFLLMFPRDERLHSVGPEVFMELIDMEQGLIRFPSIARLAESVPAYLEFHRAPSCSIPAMALNGFNHELLFVVLCHQ